MNNNFLELLNYMEYLIPIIFLWFTHFIDEKIHKRWAYINHHPDKVIRLINRYQWELCFLVVSLLAIRGIDILNEKSDELFAWGLAILGLAACSIIFLFIQAIVFIDTKSGRMKAATFHLSVFVYIFYISISVYFHHASAEFLTIAPGVRIIRWYIFPTALVVSIIVWIILKKIIAKRLNEVLLSSDDVSRDISIFRNKRVAPAKRSEALYYIIKYFLEQDQPGKAQKWIKIGEKEFPMMITGIREVLKL